MMAIVEQISNAQDSKSMMELVRDGRVSTIIVKDLSRFGRNHIEVDTYLEQIFPFLNVRFIAINDNVDSMKYESGMPNRCWFPEILLTNIIALILPLK